VASKGYDLFISYSQQDRELVTRVADDLTKARVRPWWDMWEMRPGDYLRERISEGIREADYFLVILSPHSLRSNWVKYELNSGMILEIETGGVKVLPVIAPGTRIDAVPHDLRAKHCLSFEPDRYQASISALVDLVNPGRRERAELLARLRRPELAGLDVEAVGRYALTGNDQVIQRAALNGLAKLGGRQAVLLTLERYLNSWGVSAIEKALETLVKLAPHHGILALTSTVLTDSRFDFDRLRLLTGVDPRLHARITDPSYQLLDDTFDRITALMNHLYDSDHVEIRLGAALARGVVTPTTTLARRVPPAPEELLSEAIVFAEHNLPGLVARLRRIGTRTMR
jgi:hypothetical protein